MPDRSTCWRWPPEENCYCGGPEEIYPHRVGTGRYRRPTNTHPARPAEQDGGIPNDAITPDLTRCACNPNQLPADFDPDPGCPIHGDPADQTTEGAPCPRP